jgi:pyruvate/oxaloacetate carboxyltransferase
LRKYTNLEVSFNIFNITSYPNLELTNVVDKVADSNLDYVYMADTHGYLDLNKDITKYEDHFKKIKKTGKKTGFHLHNHTGRAYMNYIKCKESPYVDLCDTSIMSLGKGAGNLSLENVLSDKKSFLLNKFIFKHYNSIFKKTVSPYYLVTGRYGITDNYATQAKKLKVSMNDFINFCCTVSGLQIDNFDKNLLKEFLK